MSDNELATSVNFLKTGDYLYVRQEFSWAAIQPSPNVFEWADYLRIVAALDTAGIKVVAVLTDTPIWARAPADVDALDAPPLSAEFYQSFCAALRAEFQTLQLFQIGNNLDDPAYWGGRSLSNITYRSMVQAAARGLDVAATDSILVAGEVGLNRHAARAGCRYSQIAAAGGGPDVARVAQCIHGGC